MEEPTERIFFPLEASLKTKNNSKTTKAIRPNGLP